MNYYHSSMIEELYSINHSTSTMIYSLLNKKYNIVIRNKKVIEELLF